MKLRRTIGVCHFVLGAVLVVVGSAAAGRAQVTHVPDCLKDEGPRDPGFLRFRTAFVAAVRARSVSLLRSMVAADVRVEDGGAGGLEAFMRIHNWSQRDSIDWRDLEEVVSDGGRFLSPEMFCAPAYSCPFLPAGARDSVLVFGKDVPVYASPTKQSQVLASLSCDLVRVGGDDLPPRPPGFL